MQQKKESSRGLLCYIHVERLVIVCQLPALVLAVVVLLVLGQC